MVLSFWLGSIAAFAVGGLQLDEVNVTGTATQSAAMARQVMTLSRPQIAALPATMSVTQLLATLPGLDVRERGAAGVQADIAIHGCTADQTIVLLNGVNLTDPQTGHYSMNLPLRTEDIERIEVYESTPQGLGAYAGVVNILTRTADTTEIDAALQAGEYGLFRPGIGARIAKGKLRMAYSGEYNQSTGYATNTDYRIANIFAHGSYGHWMWQGGVQMKNAGANSFYSLAYPNQFDATRMLFVSGSYHGKVAAHWRIDADLSYRAHYDRFELFRTTEADDDILVPAWYTGHNRHWTHSLSGDVKASFLSRIGTTSIGVTTQEVLLRSNTLGNHNRLTAHYYVQQTFHLTNWSLSLLAGGTSNTAFRADWSYAVDLSYRPASWVSLFAHTSRALRLPTFTDLYYTSKTQVGDASLKAEHAYKVSAGADFHHAWQNMSLEGRLSAYYRNGRDVIDWICLPTEITWHAANHTLLHSWGCDARVVLRAQRPIGGFLRSVSAGYSYADTDKAADGYLSKYALDYLQHHAYCQLEHTIWRRIGASWSLHFRQRSGTYTDRDDIICTYRPVWLLNGSIFWQGKQLRIALECRNMANQTYYDYGGILQPKHQVLATVAYHICP